MRNDRGEKLRSEIAQLGRSDTVDHGELM